jgi:transposase
MTNWVRRSKAGTLGEIEATPARRQASELEAENARSRRELANAKLDLEIARESAAYFAKESR